MAYRKPLFLTTKLFYTYLQDLVTSKAPLGNTVHAG